MALAPVEKTYKFADFPEVEAGRVKWAMSTLRLKSENRQQLIDLAEKILNAWRSYSDESIGIFHPHAEINVGNVNEIIESI